MRGYINIPRAISCRACSHCGARPIISMVEQGDYVVKCPNNDSHYQTNPGLIDIDDWNLHNMQNHEVEFDQSSMIACHDSQLNYTMFLTV
jgi:hypothetical protein